jgi:hypothetical protein
LGSLQFAVGVPPFQAGAAWLVSPYAGMPNEAPRRAKRLPFRNGLVTFVEKRRIDTGLDSLTNCPSLKPQQVIAKVRQHLENPNHIRIRMSLARDVQDRRRFL